MPRPAGGGRLKEAIGDLREAGVDVLVSLLEDHEVESLQLLKEGEVSRANGITFLSHPIPDHDVPTDEEETVAFVRSLGELYAEGKSVVIHCFAGIGRSANPGGVRPAHVGDGA